MKKILVVSPGYPSHNNIYNNAFVHMRVKNYKKENLEVKVFSYAAGSPYRYRYEGIDVTVGGIDELRMVLNKNHFSKILLHFAFKAQTKVIIDYINKNEGRVELLVWVHGVEALAWYRRLFYLNSMSIFKFLGYIVVNIRQLLFMRKLIINKRNRVTFVFVSEWMKRILEKDTLTFGKVSNYKIIPNPIDGSIFNYVPKTRDDRLKVLSIRPYDSRKYANDLSVKALLELSKTDYFNKFSFIFYGDGKLFNKTLEPLKKFNNVKIEKRFLNHKEIADLHKKNGILLIPTRQDAQGVSMCEGMSSGLVPITSDNTAIPEYTTDKCAYLTKNWKEIKDALIDVYNNGDKYLKMSKEAEKFIRHKSSLKVALRKEIGLIKR